MIAMDQRGQQYILFDLAIPSSLQFLGTVSMKGESSNSHSMYITL